MQRVVSYLLIFVMTLSNSGLALAEGTCSANMPPENPPVTKVEGKKEKKLGNGLVVAEGLSFPDDLRFLQKMEKDERAPHEARLLNLMGHALKVPEWKDNKKNDNKLFFGIDVFLGEEKHVVHFEYSYSA